MDDEKLQVVGIGTAALDYLGMVDKMPQFNDLEAVYPQRWMITGGGPVATALVTLARLGVATGYIGMLGDDMVGHSIRGYLMREGVDISRVIHNPEVRSPTAVVLVETGTGKRAFLSFRDDMLVFPLTEFDYDLIRSARFLHLDGRHYDLAVPAAQEAKNAGVQICLDAYRLDQQTLKWVNLTDVLIAAETFPTKYTGERDLFKASNMILKQGPKIVVTTLSERGCIVVTGNNQMHIPGFNVEVVDTTGAGDVFHGAFLYGLLQDWDIHRIARFANAAGALKCQRFAGWAGIPTLAEVEKLLGQQAE
jgi:sulfofructose kinase